MAGARSGGGCGAARRWRAGGSSAGGPAPQPTSSDGRARQRRAVGGWGVDTWQAHRLDARGCGLTPHRTAGSSRLSAARWPPPLAPPAAAAAAGEARAGGQRGGLRGGTARPKRGGRLGGRRSTAGRHDAHLTSTAPPTFLKCLGTAGCAGRTRVRPAARRACAHQSSTTRPPARAPHLHHWVARVLGRARLAQHGGDERDGLRSGTFGSGVRASVRMRCAKHMGRCSCRASQRLVRPAAPPPRRACSAAMQRCQAPRPPTWIVLPRPMSSASTPPVPRTYCLRAGAGPDGRGAAQAGAGCQPGASGLAGPAGAARGAAAQSLGSAVPTRLKPARRL